MPASQNTRPKILVVDDDVMILKILSLALDEYEVVCFSQGSEAIEHLKQHPEISYDLIISDFGMPYSDGVEILTQAHAWAPHASRMLMSGTIAEDLIRVCIENSFDQYLVKPFSIDELQHCVSELLARAEARRMDSTFVHS